MKFKVSIQCTELSYIRRNFVCQILAVSSINKSFHQTSSDSRRFLKGCFLCDGFFILPHAKSHWEMKHFIALAMTPLARFLLSAFLVWQLMAVMFMLLTPNTNGLLVACKQLHVLQQFLTCQLSSINPEYCLIASSHLLPRFVFHSFTTPSLLHQYFLLLLFCFQNYINVDFLPHVNPILCLHF